MRWREQVLHLRAKRPRQNRPPPTLLHALLRAAAADHTCTDVLALCQQFLAATPNPSAQARRALWPTLRRLRRVSSSA